MVNTVRKFGPLDVHIVDSIDCALAVEHVLSPEDRAGIIHAVLAQSAHMQGAGVADMLAIMDDNDYNLDFIESEDWNGVDRSVAGDDDDDDVLHPGVLRIACQAVCTLRGQQQATVAEALELARKAHKRLEETRT